MLEIKKIGINGEGIAYQDRKPVFIPGVFPGEVVEIKEEKKEKNYTHAQVKRLLKKSPFRIKSPCPHSEECDACPLMTLNYGKQLEEKNELLRESLYKYAGIRLSSKHKITPAKHPLFYRNSLKLPVKMDKGKLATGMYKQGSNHFVKLNGCVVHEKRLEKIHQEIIEVLNKFECKSYDKSTKSGIRTIILRGFDNEYQCTLITGKTSLSEEIISELMKIEGLVSLYQGVDTRRDTYDLFYERLKLLAGKETIALNLFDFSITLYPQSFFQLNKEVAQDIYAYVSNRITPNISVVEAYAGVGGISLCISKKSKKVIGIESSAMAVKNAKEIIKRNNIKNLNYICGDSAREFDKVAKKEKIHTVIVDPPRSGLSKEMIRALLNSKVKEIIYISCNYSTLGKNLKELLTQFNIQDIQGFDMFPHTSLVETVVSLKRKNNG